MLDTPPFCVYLIPTPHTHLQTKNEVEMRYILNTMLCNHICKHAATCLWPIVVRTKCDSRSDNYNLSIEIADIDTDYRFDIRDFTILLLKSICQ